VAWQGRLRKTDLLARYGGEEFAVLLPDCGLDDAMEISDRLRTAQPEGTCSIGVATWDTREHGAELVARADRALYAAKKSGRNRCCADRTAGAESASWAPTR
jgi:diguanylate cyclase (GGDEF)-like protein